MLLHADNFSIYGGPNPQLMLNGVYAEANCNLIADPDGISGGRVFSQDPYGAPSNNTIPFRYILQNGGVTALGASFRLWLTALPSSDGALFDVNFRDVSNNLVARIFVTANGRLALDIDGAPSTIYTTIPVVTANGWYHIEWKHSIDPSGTTCDDEIRIEGFTVLFVENSPCAPHSIGMVRTSSGNISRNYTACLKDFVLWDTNGTQNNDFLGAVLVTNVGPISDLALNWIPSIGTTGYQILDNVPPDPTQYISALLPQINTPYKATMADLPTDSTTVKGVITYVRAAKTDGGDGSLQTSLISGVAQVDGSNRPITVAQTYWRDVFERDPATNAPWTPAAVNAANVQINRTV